MSKQRWFKMHPFPIKFTLVTNPETLTKLCKQKKWASPDLTESLGATGDFGKHQVVFVETKQDTWDIFDTVVHESTHVFQHMIEYIGEDTVGKEFEAYCIGFISTTLLKELARQQKEHNALHEKRPEGLQT